MEARVYQMLGPRRLQIVPEEIDVDTLEGTQIAAETIFSALSPGTELAAYRGDPPLRPGNVYPRLVGYCNVAEIINVGQDVTAYCVGDRILTFQSHRSAFVCSEESVVAPVPAETDLKQAATTYLFHLGYDALLRGALQAGQRVGVIGLGTLGLTTVALAAHLGGDVCAYSDQEESRKLATEFGASRVASKREANAGPAADLESAETGLDLVVTTSNLWEDWRLGLRLAALGGRISVLGFPGRSQQAPEFNPLDSQYFYDKQLTLVACGQHIDRKLSRGGVHPDVRKNCQFLLGLIAQGSLPADRITSAVRDWNELESAYQILDKRERPFLTCVLKWKQAS